MRARGPPRSSRGANRAIRRVGRRLPSPRPNALETSTRIDSIQQFRGPVADAKPLADKGRNAMMPAPRYRGGRP